MYGQDQDDIVMPPVDHAEVQNRGSVRPEDQPERGDSRSIRPKQVNSLNDAFPSVKPVLYPVASPTQLADTPQPVHFTNLDLILVKARSDESDRPRA